LVTALFVVSTVAIAGLAAYSLYEVIGG
jgi:hypothetical protein